MTDKYVDISLTTGANDGTSPADAWQSLVDVLDGSPTNGSYAAGDVIHIRTAASGSSLSETYSGSLTIPEKPGSMDDPVEWRFDDGTEWTGDAGVLTLSQDGYTITVESGNFINAGDAQDQRLKVFVASAPTDASLWNGQGGSFTKGVWLQRGPGLATNRDLYLTWDRPSGTDPGQVVRFEGMRVQLMQPESGSGAVSAANGVVRPNNNGDQPIVRILDCEFQMYSGLSGCVLADVGRLRGNVIQFLGCRLTDTATDQELFKAYNTGDYGARVDFVGCDLGLVDVSSTYLGSNYAGAWEVNVENHNGTDDFYHMTNVGVSRWQRTGNYPYLNASMPDNSGMSVLIWPDSYRCNRSNPYTFHVSTKIYNGTAATKTISVELLLKDTAAFANPQKDEWWVDVMYIDENGVTRSESSRATGALAQGNTSGWSSYSYGANSYDPYKCELTTQYAIKQDHAIHVSMYVNRPAINPLNSSSGDFCFIDPDFQIT